MTHLMVRFSEVQRQQKLPESHLPGAWKSVHREVLLHGICWEAALWNARGSSPWGSAMQQNSVVGRGHHWVSYTLLDIVQHSSKQRKTQWNEPRFSCSVLSSHLLTTFIIVSPEKRDMFMGSISNIISRVMADGFGNETQSMDHRHEISKIVSFFLSKSKGFFKT